MIPSGHEETVTLAAAMLGAFRKKHLAVGAFCLGVVYRTPSTRSQSATSTPVCTRLEFPALDRDDWYVIDGVIQPAPGQAALISIFVNRSLAARDFRSDFGFSGGQLLL